MYGHVPKKKESSKGKTAKLLNVMMHVQVNKFEWLFLTLTLVPILVVVIDIFSKSKKKNL